MCVLRHRAFKLEELDYIIKLVVRDGLKRFSRDTPKSFEPIDESVMSNLKTEIRLELHVVCDVVNQFSGTFCGHGVVLQKKD